MLAVPLVVVLGETRLSEEQLSGLGPGEVITLDREDGEPLDVFAGEELFARGEVVVVEGMYGVKITEVPPQPRKETPSTASGSPDDAVTVSAILGATVLYPKEVENLQAKHVVTLQSRDGESIDVCAEGALIAKGEVVVIDGQYGVKITRMQGGGGVLRPA